jgi:hypothetical protein
MGKRWEVCVLRNDLTDTRSEDDAGFDLIG